MTKYLLTIIVAALMVSCTSFKQFESDCKPIKQKFFQDVTSLLLTENVEILTSNLDNGLIIGQKYYNWWGMVKITVQYNNAKILFNLKDAMNDSFDDSTKFELYWTIKNGLESICGTKLVMVKKK